MEAYKLQSAQQNNSTAMLFNLAIWEHLPAKHRILSVLSSRPNFIVANQAGQWRHSEYVRLGGVIMYQFSTRLRMLPKRDIHIYENSSVKQNLQVPHRHITYLTPHRKLMSRLWHIRNHILLSPYQWVFKNKFKFFSLFCIPIVFPLSSNTLGACVGLFVYITITITVLLD